jgi:hypothetical protein
MTIADARPYEVIQLDASDGFNGGPPCPEIDPPPSAATLHIRVPRNYSPGLFMVMIFAYGMFRLRARPAIRLTFALIVFSEFVYAFMANDAVDQSHRLFSFYYFLFSTLYLTSFAVIGCAIVVELERTAREAYSRERQLAVSNQSIKTTNTELEQLNGALEDSKRDPAGTSYMPVSTPSASRTGRTLRLCRSVRRAIVSTGEALMERRLADIPTRIEATCKSTSRRANMCSTISRIAFRPNSSSPSPTAMATSPRGRSIATASRCYAAMPSNAATG